MLSHKQPEQTVSHHGPWGQSDKKPTPAFYVSDLVFGFFLLALAEWKNLFAIILVVKSLDGGAAATKRGKERKRPSEWIET